MDKRRRKLINQGRIKGSQAGVTLVDLLIGTVIIVFTIMASSVVMKQISTSSTQIRGNSRVEAAYRNVSETLRRVASTTQGFDGLEGTIDPFPYPYATSLHCKAVIAPMDPSNRTRKVDLFFTGKDSTKQFSFYLAQTQDKITGTRLKVKAVVKGHLDIPIPGILMSAPSSEASVAMCVTDAQGICSLVGVRTTDPTLTVTADGKNLLYYTDDTTPAGFQISRDVSVGSGASQDITQAPFQFRAPGTIQGSVTDVTVDGAFKPATGVFYQLYSRPGSCVIPGWAVYNQLGTTNANGTFKIPVIPGDYVVLLAGSDAYAAIDWADGKHPWASDYNASHWSPIASGQVDSTHFNFNTLHRGNMVGKVNKISGDGSNWVNQGQVVDAGYEIQFSPVWGAFSNVTGETGAAFVRDILPLKLYKYCDWFPQPIFDSKGTGTYRLDSLAELVLVRDWSDSSSGYNFRNESIFMRNSLTWVDPPLVPIAVNDPSKAPVDSILLATPMGGTWWEPEYRPLGKNSMVASYAGRDNNQDMNILTVDAMANIKGEIKIWDASSGAYVPFNSAHGGITGGITVPSNWDSGSPSATQNLGGISMSNGRYWVDGHYQASTWLETGSDGIERHFYDMSHGLSYRAIPPNVGGIQTHFVFQTPLVYQGLKPIPFAAAISSEGKRDPVDIYAWTPSLEPVPDMNIVLELRDRAADPNCNQTPLATFPALMSGGNATITANIDQWLAWNKSFDYAMAPGSSTVCDLLFGAGEQPTASYKNYKLTVQNLGSGGIRQNGWAYIYGGLVNTFTEWTGSNGFSNSILLNKVHRCPHLYGHVTDAGGFPIAGVTVTARTMLDYLVDHNGDRVITSSVNAYNDGSGTGFEYVFPDLDYIQSFYLPDVIVFAKAPGYQDSAEFSLKLNYEADHRFDIILQKVGDQKGSNL